MEKRSSMIGGIILIVVGVLFLVVQLFPGLTGNVDLTRQWPLIIMAAGGFFLLAALAGTPPLAVPGAIIGGIGSILYYQNLTGDWDSWAYIWALIPGFVGLGIFLMYLLQQQAGRGLREGGRLVIISALLFVVFAGFFNGFGLGRYWPVGLIVVGGWMLVKRR